MTLGPLEEPLADGPGLATHLEVEIHFWRNIVSVRSKRLNPVASRPVPLEEYGPEGFEDGGLARLVGLADEVQTFFEAREPNRLAELAEVLDAELPDLHSAPPRRWAR